MRFALAFGLALAATPAVRRVGVAAGLLDRPASGALKIHDRPVPLVGGPAAILAAAAALWLAGTLPSGWLMIAVGLALAAGLIDDAAPLPPWPRLAAQIGAGVVLVASIDIPLVVALVVVMITVACANAVNIMDGQDGLAGGLAAIAGLGLAGSSAVWDAHAGVTLGMALAGGLAGFVAWNLSTVRIFMGNGGAYAIGTALAGLAGIAIAAEGWRGAMAAGVCLGPFAFELVFTIARRLLAGGLTRGDRLHSYDLLAARHARSRVTFGFWIAGAVCAGVGVLVASIPPAAGLAVAAAACAAAFAAAIHLWTRHTSSIEGG